MEKINIAQFLKDCPKGMELYSPLCGNCELYDVNEYNIRIETPNKDTLISLYHDGRYCINGEIMLFPKGKTTWEGFVPPCKFKDGDIVATNSGAWIGITIGGESIRPVPTYCVVESDGTFKSYFAVKGLWGFDRLATKKEKEKLFKILKYNGYYWNSETKTLERLIKPIFKAGNKIRSKNKKDECFYILNVDKDRNKYILNIKGYCLEFKDQDNYELVSDKFNIDTLKPFDKVLVRDHDRAYWDITFYECYDSKNKSYPYRTLGGTVYKQCIPYKGNEHLAGFVKECSDYYKIWVNE